MSDALKLLLIGLTAYAMGNINPSIILGKLYKLDIRNEGSGNAGMTNTMRVIGAKAGIIVFAVDTLKAFLAVKLGFIAGGTAGTMIAFACVVIGHCFPALWGFKGGKGVASSFGAILAMDWRCALGMLAVAALVFLFSRRVSAASVIAAASFPVFLHFLRPEYFLFGIAAAVYIILMHHENIVRLLKGEEKPLTIGHREDNK